MADISMLLHRQLKEVNVYGNWADEVEFVTESGSVFVMFHNQDCCESVQLEEVIGDLDDLVGAPILLAECVTSSGGDPPADYVESHTWTFYKLATHKGHVTFRWLGTSNGYYSEEADFELRHLSLPDFFAHQCGALVLPYDNPEDYMKGDC